METFGASTKTLSIGGQSSLNEFDAENNFYSPAILGFAKGNNYSLSSLTISPNFKPISNVVVKNSLSDNVSSNQFGSVDTDYGSSMHGIFHANLPLMKRLLKTRLGLSIYFPIKKLIETSTGDFFLPEYVFYRSRYQRTGFSFNVIQPFFKGGKPDWAFSIGGIGKFQTQGETSIVARGFGDTGPSTGKAKFQVEPGVSLQLSFVKILKDASFAITLQDEQENELSTDAIGYTPISTGNSLPFDLTLESMLYYDPAIARFNYMKDFKEYKFLASAEVQFWSGYKTAKLNIISRSGFNSSKNYERLDTRDIIIPRVALVKHLRNKQDISLGAYYKQSPLESDLNNASNSIDPDVFAISAGYSKRIEIKGEKLEINAALQYQHLKTEDIYKTTGKEDGTPGQKIGAPGYEIGGNIIILSVGFNWRV